MNFHSSVNMKIKLNLVLGMKNRLYKICHPDFYNKNLNKLYSLLRDNSYPEDLLNKLLRREADRTPTIEPDVNPSSEEDPIEATKYGTLPNITNLTPKLVDILKPTNTKIAIKNVKTVGNLYSKTKDKTKPQDKSNVVYRIGCQDCTSTYIGQTSRKLKGRITSHKSDCRTGKTPAHWQNMSQE